MGEVVNLRLIRKRKARHDAATAADQNRTRHGEAGADKKLRKADAESATRRLDGHRLRGKTDDPD
jgi:hypothetical protein